MRCRSSARYGRGRDGRTGICHAQHARGVDGVVAVACLWWSDRTTVSLSYCRCTRGHAVHILPSTTNTNYLLHYQTTCCYFALNERRAAP